MRIRLFILLSIYLIILTGCTPADQVINEQKNISSNASEKENDPNQYSEDAKIERGYILPDSDKRIISENELEFFDKFTLNLAKNELFARKGYRFKDTDLYAYFANKEWYNPISKEIVEFDDLNEIEKSNFKTIDKKYKEFLQLAYKEPEFTRVLKLDIDSDGIEEVLKALFTNEAGDYKCLITVISSGKEFRYEEIGNLENKLYIADFNDKDNYIEFYLYDDGPSGDPTTHIFRYKNNQIIKLTQLDGFITAYDGAGRICTEFSRTWDKYKQTLSYYELENGITYAKKEDIKGKQLQYDHKIILFDGSQAKGYTLESEVSGLSNEEIFMRYDQNQIVKICEPNELLKIVDIDNTYWGLFKEGCVKNIRIMVETEDGKRGWLEWMNGGD